MRELCLSERRIASAVAAKLSELEKANIRRPTHVAVHRTQFLGVGELLGLKLVRVGYIREDEAAVLVKVEAGYLPRVQVCAACGKVQADRPVSATAYCACPDHLATLKLRTPAARVGDEKGGR